MQALLNRLRQSQSQSQSSSRSNPISISSTSTPTSDAIPHSVPARAPPEPVASDTETPTAVFTGVRKIHPNQDALLSSRTPPPSSQPSSPTFPQQIDRPLSPPTVPTRRPSNEPKHSITQNRNVGETIRESNESEHPSVVANLPSQDEIISFATAPGAGEEGNLSRSSSRRTTGLFSAVPFSGGTGAAWSTFGRSQRRRKSTDDQSSNVPLPVTGKSASAGKNSDGSAGKGSGEGVSRTSSQSKTTTPRTKSTNLSRSGSTKHATHGTGMYQPDIEHIEHYTRIPIISPSSTDTNINKNIHRNDHRVNNELDDGSPQLLSRSDSLSSPQQESTPSTSSPHQTVFNDPRRADSSDSTAQNRQSRVDGTYPPRTTVAKPELLEEGGVSSSLPFTFGRQGPIRPMAGEIFLDEFGRSIEGNDERRSFPLIETPSEFPSDPQTNANRTHLPSNISTYDGVPHPIPSLISDSSSPDQNAEASPSVTTPTTTGKGGWPFGTPLPLRGMPSFGSSGDELGHPRILTDPESSPIVEGNVSNNEWAMRQGSKKEGRRRISGRRHSSGKLLPGKKSLGELRMVAIEPIVVMSAEVPRSNSQAFPSQERIAPANVEEEAAVASTSARGGHRRPTSDTTAIEPSTSSTLAAAGDDQLRVSPPEVSITSPTPRPSPSRPTPSSNIPSTSTANTNTASPIATTTTRLSELFQRHAPEGYAHPSGVGVVGVGEPHSRRQSLKVMGKRKAGDSDSDVEGIVVFDERSTRPRTGSNGKSFSFMTIIYDNVLTFFYLIVPSSYMRKRMKLSDASEKDAQPARSALAPTPSRSSKPSAAASMHSTNSRPKSIDSTRPRSITSTRPLSALSRSRRPISSAALSTTSIPISAIVSPRAPSIRYSITSTRRDGGQTLRFQDPLKNRVQKRRKREVWADSWRFERHMVWQAYLFLMGFALPVAWWVGVFLPVRKRVRRGDVEAKAGADTERKNVPPPAPPTVGMVDRSNSGLWTDVTPYEEEQKRLWRGRCLVAAILGTAFWVTVIVCAVVFSRR